MSFVSTPLPLFNYLSRSDILSTPQRQQQRTRQALRELANNVQDSPRRRTPLPRPETPTPSAERAGVGTQPPSCTTHIPPQRLLHRHDENNPGLPVEETVRSLTVQSQAPTVRFFMSISVLSAHF